MTQKDNNKQLWQQLSGAAVAGLGFKLQSAHKRQKTGQPSQVKSRKMRGSNKLPKRGVEVRTSEREGRREG